MCFPSLLRSTTAGFLLTAFMRVTLPAATAPQYILLSDNPAALTTLADDLSVINTFTIAGDFTEAVVGPGGEHVYVLYNGLFGSDGRVLRGKGKLRIYQTATGKLLAEHGLGWDSRGLLFSPDRKYAVVLSRGWQYTEQQADPDGLLTAVDTSTLQVAARIPAGRLLTQALFTPDGSRLIALASGRIYYKKPKRPTDFDMISACNVETPIKERQTVEARLTVLAPPDFRAVSTLKLNDAPHGMSFANDGNTLVFVDRGMPHWRTGRQEMGSVQVVDFSTQKVVARHPSGAASLVAASASNRDEFFVISSPKFNDCRLQLSHWRDDRFDPCPDFGSQVGCPYSAVPVSNGRRLLVSLLRDCDQIAELRSQIAVVDLATAKVEREIDVGRKGVRVAKAIGGIALLATFTLPTMIVNAAIGFPHTIKAPERIWVSEDGASAFVLDIGSDDVTVLEIDSGKVLGHIPVGGGPLGLLAAPSGGLLLAISRYQLTWMDQQSGKMRGQQSLESEAVSAAFRDERGKRIILLTDKGVLTWDGDRPGTPRRANPLRGRLLVPVTQAL